jgi:sirohydrochlorin ferrochelatase
MHETVPRLLVVAHGTASPTGSATTARLVDAVRAARPDRVVDLAFLDVVEPRLPDVLDDRLTVLVPLLLSTGYHVRSDIPAAVSGRPNVHIARHLGPHPLLVEALADRLAELPAADGAAVDRTPSARTVLVGAGSSRPEADAELAEAGRLLAARLGRPVEVHTMAEDLPRVLRAGGSARVATYLLAEGRFVDTLRAAADGWGVVAAPIGVHPALVRLVWTRYDEAAG